VKSEKRKVKKEERRKKKEEYGGEGEDMDIQLKKGLLEGCVLRAIRHDESYGYKIMQEISPYVEISESTLYPVLKRLDDMRLVTTRTQEHNGRLRKYYMITEAGINKIQEFKNDLAELKKINDYICKD
jgi:PadR family transcriptional regulator PadR